MERKKYKDILSMDSYSLKKNEKFNKERGAGDKKVWAKTWCQNRI